MPGYEPNVLEFLKYFRKGNILLALELTTKKIEADLQYQPVLMETQLKVAVCCLLRL